MTRSPDLRATTRLLPMQRQLVFGLDACSGRSSNASRGTVSCRNLRTAAPREAHGTLTTTARCLPDTVWSCIYSGQNRDLRQIFLRQYDPRTRDLRHVLDDSFTQRPFWKLCSGRASASA